MLGEYYLKAGADIDAMADEAKIWRRRIEKADSSVMRQYYDEIQGIENKCDAARIALKECVIGGENISEDKKQGLEKALDAVRGALEDLAARAKDVVGD
ncbi:MAG: hypothetical protein ACYC5O_13480 [Anaerolineae bacterium]